MQVEINPSEYTVLIVDDTIANVLLLKVLIGNQKYRIVTAGNGMEALQAVEKESPDLILLDIMMPGMNGYEVAEKLKADPQTQEIPIIFLTALNSTNDIVKGFKTGASDYISKPFNKEELLIRVTHQISLIAAKRLIASQMKELQSTIRGRDRLYSVIAHDLRSPMGSLKMIFNLLIAQLPPEKIGPEMYDMLSMANHTAEETFSLLDNLLKWTKSQIGRLKTVYQEIDMMDDRRCRHTLLSGRFAEEYQNQDGVARSCRCPGGCGYDQDDHAQPVEQCRQIQSRGQRNYSHGGRPGRKSRSERTRFR